MPGRTGYDLCAPVQGRSGAAARAGLHPRLQPAAIRRGARPESRRERPPAQALGHDGVHGEGLATACAGRLGAAVPAAPPRASTAASLPTPGHGGRRIRRDQHRLRPRRARRSRITTGAPAVAAAPRTRAPGPVVGSPALRSSPAMASAVAAASPPQERAGDAAVADPGHAPRGHAPRASGDRPGAPDGRPAAPTPSRRDAASSRGAARRPHDDRPAGRRRADSGRMRPRLPLAPPMSPSMRPATGPIAPLAPPAAPVMSFAPPPAAPAPRRRAMTPPMVTPPPRMRDRTPTPPPAMVVAARGGRGGLRVGRSEAGRDQRQGPRVRGDRQALPRDHRAGRLGGGPRAGRGHHPRAPRQTADDLVRDPQRVPRPPR